MLMLFFFFCLLFLHRFHPISELIVVQFLFQYFFVCRSKPTEVPKATGLLDAPTRHSIAVTFHALVPLAAWEWDDRSKMHIRFGLIELGDWKYNCGDFQMRLYKLHNSYTASPWNYGI